MIKQTEVDGVPTLVAPMSGPLRAGLVFRVGVADEPLSRAGITHLLEHLALFRHGLADHEANAATGLITTQFFTQGAESEVITYLRSVCQSLGDLPLDRLETEKSILRTERAGRGDRLVDAMGLWRYGSRGHGIAGYPELGLPRLTAEDLGSWAATWFTRDNAVLWIASEGVPAGLSLPLPQGERRPLPPITSALPATPAYFASEDGQVMFDAVVRRSTAASLYGAVLERELFRALRQEDGNSYRAGASYHPRGDQFATLVAVADSLPEKQDAVLGGFVDVLAKLKVGRIEQSDVDSARDKALTALTDPDVDAMRLPGMAVNLLTGYPSQSTEQLRAELRAVSAQDVHAVAVEAMSTGLLLVPAGHAADWAGFVPAPTRSDTAVGGTVHPGLREDGTGIAVTAEGITMTTPSGPLTVLFAACSVMLTWPDGARRLIGHDAITVHVEPTLHTVPPQELALIDAGVDPEVVVPMPARDPEDIPAFVPRAPRPASSGTSRWSAMTVIYALIATASLVFGLVLLVKLIGQAASSVSEWRAVVVLWIAGAYCAVQFVKRYRRSG
ncbi:hypothetical protein GCM10010174_45940 [Kutzneria viridogrisea]|uniref:Zn-dependent peptidase n=1 Tax=Kutzneria viridogrisea TaxID=47990 RepID=A0ABR6BGI0_9PSEU|nr:putative Zn-dependent peptidase [Kutzneria viridogrisea]